MSPVSRVIADVRRQPPAPPDLLFTGEPLFGGLDLSFEDSGLGT